MSAIFRRTIRRPAGSAATAAADTGAARTTAAHDKDIDESAPSHFERSTLGEDMDAAVLMFKHLVAANRADRTVVRNNCSNIQGGGGFAVVRGNGRDDIGNICPQTT